MPQFRRYLYGFKAFCRGLDVLPLFLPVASPSRVAREGPDDARPGPSFTSVPVIFSPKLYHHFKVLSTIHGQMYTGSFFQGKEDDKY